MTNPSLRRRRMSAWNVFSVLGTGLLAFGACLDAQAKLDLPALFSDHMVLQRNQPIHVWGWTDANQAVTVELAGVKPWQSKDGPTKLSSRSVTVQADGQGRFDAYLDPIEDAGQYNFTATAGTDAIAYKDVLIGEVWFCSGQSNMEWNVEGAARSKAIIADANRPAIRLFQAPMFTSEKPVQDVDAHWNVCSSQTVTKFSAVGYNFGRNLQEALDAPVGLIHSSWGGTPAEAWTSWASMQNNPMTAPIIDRTLASRKQPAGPDRHSDPGVKTNDAKLTQADFDDSGWKSLHLPNDLNAIEAGLDGVVWFRTMIDLPKSLQGQALTLSLGPIDDTDITYVNGQEIGRIGQDQPNHFAIDRVYTVPATLTKQGKLTIAVRVFDMMYGGGFAGRPEQLFVGNDENKVSLAKDWQYFIQHPMHDWQIPRRIAGQNQASTLYHAMVLPYAGYNIKGAIWYQGESNAGRAKQYQTLLPMMVQDWRNVWNIPGEDKNFAFGIVELASFMQPSAQPSNHDWAELREAQHMTAENVPNTGIVSILDIGNANDIHPRNKHEVGRRLALWAQATQYGQDVVFEGPSLANATFNNGKATLTLNANDPSGFAKVESPIGGFAIAGDDHKFHWATVEQQVNTFVLTSPDVKNPVAVRYAWHANPWDQAPGTTQPPARIKNAAGLPMAPFRTDDWPGVTDNNR